VIPMMPHPNASDPSSEYDDILQDDIWDDFTTQAHETVLQARMLEEIEDATDDAWM